MKKIFIVLVILLAGSSSISAKTMFDVFYETCTENTELTNSECRCVASESEKYMKRFPNANPEKAMLKAVLSCVDD